MYTEMFQKAPEGMRADTMLKKLRAVAWVKLAVNTALRGVSERKLKLNMMDTTVLTDKARAGGRTEPRVLLLRPPRNQEGKKMGETGILSSQT